MKSLTFILICTLSFNVFGQDYFEGEVLRYEDRIYQPNIKTVTFFPESKPYSLPIIRLNGGNGLKFDFDDLDGDYKTYNYKIIHCNSDWTPSDLLPNEYLEGFFNFNIEDITYSSNTYQPYTHYSVNLPNDFIKFKLSGNYLLIVYTDSPEFPVITRRFMIYEEIVNVGMDIKRPANLDLMYSHQEVDFFVNMGAYSVNDPMQDIKVTLIQNYDWNRAITDLKPRFISNGVLDFDWETGNLFEGGNEFRNFDTKSLQSLSLNVQKTELKDQWYVYLAPDIPLNNKKYSYQDDIEGLFVVRKLDSPFPEQEADYPYVNFKLKMEGPIQNGKVFVTGAFSNYQLTPEYELKWDDQSRSYQNWVSIKQGYYNYRYVVLYDGSAQPVLEPIEGSFWETRNQYTLLVYSKELGKRYEKLVGYMSFYSRQAN